MRLDKELTQLQLAQGLNWIQTKVSKLELGNLEPDTSTLIKLSRFFDVSSDYLLGLSNDMYAHIKKLRLRKR